MSDRYRTLVDNPGLVRRSQGYLISETHKVDDAKVRLHIYRDAYAAQCQVFAEVWSPTALQWSRAVTRDVSLYDLPSYVTRDDQPILDAAEEVLDDLYAYVVALLS